MIECPQCKYKFQLEKRSLNQNSFFHYLANEIAEYCGYSLAAMKQLLKEEFGYYFFETNKRTGEVFKVYTSTANMSKKDLAEFTEKVLILGNEKFNLNLMSSNKFFMLNLNRK